MTEAEWLACGDPTPMLDFLQGAASDRKMRLFEVACCRRLWWLLDDKHCRKLVEISRQLGGYEELEGRRLNVCRMAVELAEYSADNVLTSEALTTISEAASAFSHPSGFYAACYSEEEGAFDVELMASGCAVQAAEAASMSRLHPTAVVWQAGRAVGYLNSEGFGQAEKGGDSTERAAHCDLLRDIFGNPFRPVAADPGWLTPTVVALAEEVYAERAFDRLPVLADALEEAGCDDPAVLAHCRGEGPHVRGCWVVDLVLGKG